MNPPQVYMCSPSWTPLLPPSPYHPSGSSQCTSSKHPVSRISFPPFLQKRNLFFIKEIPSWISESMKGKISPTCCQTLYWLVMPISLFLLTHGIVTFVPILKVEKLTDFSHLSIMWQRLQLNPDPPDSTLYLYFSSLLGCISLCKRKILHSICK